MCIKGVKAKENTPYVKLVIFGNFPNDNTGSNQDLTENFFISENRPVSIFFS